MTHDDPNQSTLFAAETVEPRRCKWKDCQTTRRNLCKYDADLEHGDPVPDRRPRSCLHAYDPRTAPLPEGF